MKPAESMGLSDMLLPTQPQIRDAGVAPRQVRGVLQAGAEAARARQS